jgi:hypothetical protein
MSADLKANTAVALLAQQLAEGSVVATGVASPLAILAKGQDEQTGETR